MVLRSLNRGWYCDGNACRTESKSKSSYRDYPSDVLYYTCDECGDDYCPTCFHLVEELTSQ